MVNGSFSTIGNLTELRKKYEDYFVVIEGAVEEDKEHIERVIKSLLSKAKFDPSSEQKGLVFRVNSKEKVVFINDIKRCLLVR